MHGDRHPFQSLQRSIRIHPDCRKDFFCRDVSFCCCHVLALLRLTAQATGKTVYAGPGEATAIGNIMAQMIKAGELTLSFSFTMVSFLLPWFLFLYS